MVELELLKNDSVIGITLYLPKVKIVLLYHTNAIVICEPLDIDDDVFRVVNVLYVNKVCSVEEMLSSKVLKYRLVDKVGIDEGMIVQDALEILQK